MRLEQVLFLACRSKEALQEAKVRRLGHDTRASRSADALIDLSGKAHRRLFDTLAKVRRGTGARNNTKGNTAILRFFWKTAKLCKL